MNLQVQLYSNQMVLWGGWLDTQVS